METSLHVGQSGNFLAKSNGNFLILLEQSGFSHSNHPL